MRDKLLIVLAFVLISFGALGHEDLNGIETVYDLYKNGSYDEALEAVDLIIDEDGANAKALALKGDILTALGRDEEAFNSYNKSFIIDPNDFDVLYKRCDLFKNFEILYSARDCCDDLLDRDPEYEEAYALHAEVEKEIAISEGYDTRGVNDTVYHNMLESYNKAVEIDRNYTSAWNNRGIVLSELSRFNESQSTLNESLASFDEAIAINSSFKEAWNNKGVALNYWNRHNESIVCYDRAIDLDPTLAEAWYNKANAVVALNMSKYEEAMTYLGKAIVLKPELYQEQEGGLNPWIYVWTR